MKRFFAIFLALSLFCGLIGCGRDAEVTETPAAEATPQPMAEAKAADAAAEGSVSIYAAEGREGWSALAELYAERSGIRVSLSESMDGATLLCVDYESMVSLAERAMALDETAAASRLSVASYAYRNSEGSILGLPLELASVGIAVNTELLEKAGYSMDTLDGFKAIRRFSTSVNDRKEELGFSGWAPMALAEEGFDKLSLYLLDQPIYAELQESGSFTGKYVGDYRDSHYKDLFTVMLDFGTKTGKDVNTVTTDEALSVFAEGSTLFCLIDSRELDTLSAKGMDLSKLDYIPAWMFLPRDDEQGFVTDATLYAAICAADTAGQHAAEDFLYWCLSDSEAVAILSGMYEGLPYEGFSCANPMLAKNAAYDAAGRSAVPWLHRQVPDLSAWNGKFLTEIHIITPDNVVWRWQVMVWALVDIWNGK